MRRYAAAWIAGFAILLVVLHQVLPADTPAPWVFAAFVAAAFVADLVDITIHHHRTSESVTLIEVAAVVAFLELSPAGAGAAVALGVLLHQRLSKRRPWLKASFNSAQHGAATTAAGVVVASVGSPPLDGTELLATLAGLLVYALVSGLAMTGLFASFGEPQPFRLFFARASFMAVTVAGNGVVGILAFVLLRTNPVLLPLLLSPIVALQLLYRQTSRTETLLSEVRVERDRLDRVVQGASEGIVLLDDAGIVRLWNPAMTAITGVDAADAHGRNARELLGGTDADLASHDPLAPLRTGTNETTEVTLQVAPSPTPAMCTHTLVFDDDGGTVGDVVLVRDLSRERAAASLKEDFVARVSHELRTPLSPIRGYAQILLRSNDRIGPDKRGQVLEQIVERVGHLERLIEDLLLVSRISSGAIEDVDEVHPEVVDLERLTVRLLDWFERDHRARTFSLDVGDGPHGAWCDPFRAGQIITNLLSNACKYSPAGTPVTVRLRRDGDDRRIEVTDQGEGIAPDQLETIFERFQRLDDPQRMRTGGIGLGLYIARHLAQRMGGSLTATSRVRHGSTFVLTLPAADDEDLAQDMHEAGAGALG